MADHGRVAPKATFQAFPAGRRGVNVSAVNVNRPLVVQRFVKEMLIFQGLSTCFYKTC